MQVSTKKFTTKRRYACTVKVRAVVWNEGELLILDQRLLPQREVWIRATQWQQVAEAIQNMAVRGAPIIGVAAAYGLVLAQIKNENLTEAMRGLSATRPTAVNLTYALERAISSNDILKEAKLIESEEFESNLRIGKYGAHLIPGQLRVITICNTGALASPGIGTALGIVRTLHSQDRLLEAILCETRPRQQGLRLSAWELSREEITFRIITDSAAASFMRENKTHLAVVGADRIARNGDTANKIGTYSLALACNFHSVPFVVAAPTSTIDKQVATGNDIPIEERDASEITNINGNRIAPENCPVWNPAFDVTPASLISAIVTEKGVENPPYLFTD